jgi:CO/xanthine dehydrogenase Mo-binding subunit
MRFAKNHFADQRQDNLSQLGQSLQRSDVPGHVTARTSFFADRNFPGMLHLKMVRSPHHHARIRRIDTSRAERHPGVIRVLTHRDVPHNVYTILILIQVGPPTRYAGKARPLLP